MGSIEEDRPKLSEIENCRPRPRFYVPVGVKRNKSSKPSLLTESSWEKMSRKTYKDLEKISRFEEAERDRELLVVPTLIMKPPTSSLLRLVPELGRPNVRMRDPEFIENAIQTMSKDAHHKLQIVADFDQTLSKHSENGQECSSTHGVLEESQLMPDSFKEEAKKLKDIYLPIEFDVSKSVEEKIPKMIEWWTKGLALLADSGLTKDLFLKIMTHSRIKLRDGCVDLFHKLHQLDIPLLIFSAGLGDVIRETINQQAKFYDNMKLVSNFFHFDELGKMAGYAGGEEIIHAFNKNENAIHSGDYFYNIRHRQNILLLGDSLGDLNMATGADNMECMLKIGFLNYRVEHSLPAFLQNFDVVIVEDESLDVVNGIMKAIVAGTE